MKRNNWSRQLLALFTVAAMLISSALAFQPAEVRGEGSFVYDPLRQICIPSAPDSDAGFEAEQTRYYTQPGSGVSALDLETVFEVEHNSYYDQLPEDAKGIYDAFDASLSAGEYSVTVDLPSLTVAEVAQLVLGAYSAYNNDHPFETSVTTGGVSYSYRGSSYTFTLATLDQPDRYLQQLEQAVEEFYAQYQTDMPQDASPLDQYRYIYEYVTSACTYNYPIAYNPYQYSTAAQTVAHSAYGALVGLDEPGAEKGCVVCQGYADAYLLLCQRLGLPCVVISGDAGGPHMWNAIKLDGAWYVLDVTWDDLESSCAPSNFSALQGQVDIATTAFRYFTDNRLFLPGTEVAQDHMALSQYQFGSSTWTITPPPLTYERKAADDLIPSSMTLTLHAPADGDCAYFSDIQQVIRSIAFPSLNLTLSDIPSVAVLLTADTVVDSSDPIAVSEKDYLLAGIADHPPVLSRGPELSDCIFSVAADRSLTLANVVLDGKQAQVSAPLIAAQGPVFLFNATLTGSSAAAAIEAENAVYLGGLCRIADNTDSAGLPANVKLNGEGRILVIDCVAGSCVGITAPEEQIVISPADGYNWTAEDRQAFTPDLDTIPLRYDANQDALLLSRMTTTDTDMPAYLTYANHLDTTVTVTNTTAQTQHITLFAAMYAQGGRLLTAQSVCTITLEAGQSSDSITLPSAPQGVDYMCLFTLEENNFFPLSERPTIPKG